ncbi:hypothetical protein [Abyssogena phaseoliformis symbiont]|uniref:hypothetical protein n=1 Tax=Abyssogena phaseoliformis symbiont TaxID=596095 RepID=UPI001CED3DD0|nr:hypothetical protein [Abyssogena phaseoliformis symbiont]
MPVLDALFQYLKGVYKGNTKDLKTRVDTYIANYQTKTIKADTLIQTRDLVSIHWTIDEVVIREQMGVIYGKTGTGKTLAVKAYVAKHPEAILIQTTPMISGKSLLHSKY